MSIRQITSSRGARAASEPEIQKQTQSLHLEFRVRSFGPSRNDRKKMHMTVQRPNSFRTGPDERGHFGIYGGRFVAETLMPLILELEKAYGQAKADPAFQKEMDGHLTHYVGRPSPLYFAERLTEHCRSQTASGSWARKFISSARSSIIPARTRSTTCSARSCWRGAWARRASSPRPAPACMVSRPRHCAPSSGCPASSTWARSTSSGSSRTCCA